VSRALREIAAPFVVAAPSGARVRTRLRVSGPDAAVLEAAGRHLGSLAGRDLAARCAEGRLDARGRAASRRERKRALTAESSSRWAGAITRTSEDQWRLADRGLRDQAASLRARVRRIESRLKAPAGSRAGQAREYATQAERWQKQRRVQVLKARLAEAERRLAEGRVSVCRGGSRLARIRHRLGEAGLTEAQWRRRWDAERMLICADGEAGKNLGNETIRVHPDEHWLEIKLPAPLAHLANRSHGRYRLGCEVTFPHRGDEVAAQAMTGAVRYDLTFDPERRRWYADASWRTPGAPAAPLEELTRLPVLAADLNAGHIAAYIVLPDGNPAGPPVTVPLDLAGLPTATRDGRLRAAISELIRIARAHGCAAVAVENLDFAEARAEGRERTGSRPSKGRRGRGYRRTVAGIPTGKFRDRLVQMCANRNLAVIAVDPAYTSAWGTYWLEPLQEKDSMATGHHAAAVVIGRRAHGYKARRREGVTGPGQRTGSRRAAPRAPTAKSANRNDGTPRAQRQPPRRKTATARRAPPPDQEAHDRSAPPTEHLTNAQ
jgi:hypothetical protein